MFTSHVSFSTYRRLSSRLKLKYAWGLLFSAFLAASTHSNTLSEGYQKTFGNYTIHYSVFNTVFLTQAVARSIAVARNPTTALLNIAVIDNRTQQPVIAEVSGFVSDLIKQTPLTFQVVNDNGSHYALSTVAITHNIDMYFTVTVTVADHPPWTFHFKKRLLHEH